MFKIKTREQSDYFKTHRPYIWSRAKDGREPDIIFYVAIKTKTGRWSKRNAYYRFNVGRAVPGPERVQEALEHFLDTLDLSRGRYVHEIIQYSGRSDFTGLTVGDKQ